MARGGAAPSFARNGNPFSKTRGGPSDRTRKAKEVKKENTADNFREDIWKTLCGLGGGKDDLF